VEAPKADLEVECEGRSGSKIVKSALRSTHWQHGLKLKMTAATLARTAPVEAAAPATCGHV
jgi:hypothetical protein